MASTNQTLILVQSFPDSRTNEFSREEWVSQFHDSNVIIHCRGKDIYYPTHWGPLSMKCAFGGKEYYQKGGCKYAVSEDNFLLLNEGTEYSSHIDSLSQELKALLAPTWCEYFSRYHGVEDYCSPRL